MSRFAEIIKKVEAKIIGIDGAPNGGKTYLAKSLRNELSGTLLQFDDYIPKNPSGRYFEFIDAARLRTDALRANNGDSHLIIDGACLRAVLDRAGIELDFVIYSRNTRNVADWIDFDISEDEYEQFVEVEDEYLPYLDGPDDEYLAMDNAWYHMKFHPVSSADEIHEWAET